MKSATILLVTTVLAAAPALAQTSATQPAQPSPTATMPAPATGAPATQTPNAAAASPTATAHHTHAASAIPPGQTMEAMVEKRISDLHRQLHITPAESSQWGQFTQVMRDNAKGTDQAYAERAQKLDSMSAVENMQSYAQIEQLRVEQTQKLVPAFQALYASLSDQQKEEADALFRNQAAKAQTHRQAAAAKHAG